MRVTSMPTFFGHTSIALFQHSANALKVTFRRPQNYLYFCGVVYRIDANRYLHTWHYCVLVWICSELAAVLRSHSKMRQDDGTFCASIAPDRAVPTVVVNIARDKAASHCRSELCNASSSSQRQQSVLFFAVYSSARYEWPISPMLECGQPGWRSCEQALSTEDAVSFAIWFLMPFAHGAGNGKCGAPHAIHDCRVRSTHVAFTLGGSISWTTHRPSRLRASIVFTGRAADA